jgi:hypothetical protein
VCRCWAEAIDAEWDSQKAGDEMNAADYEGFDECAPDVDPDLDDTPSQSANCPCGRRFPGGDGSTVCPHCKITVREAWHDHFRAIDDAALRRDEEDEW